MNEHKEETSKNEQANPKLRKERSSDLFARFCAEANKDLKRMNDLAREIERT